MTNIVRTAVPLSRLTFAGRRQHVKPCKPRRAHTKTVFDVIGLGHYYVVAEKTSTILRSSTIWPIQEPVQLSGLSVTWSSEIRHPESSGVSGAAGLRIAATTAGGHSESVTRAGARLSGLRRRATAGLVPFRTTLSPWLQFGPCGGRGRSRQRRPRPI